MTAAQVSLDWGRRATLKCQLGLRRPLDYEVNPGSDSRIKVTMRSSCSCR